MNEAFLLLPPSHIPLHILLILVWLTILGGTIGSFLNVVVYRLPEGRSLVHPGSRCPACRCPIRWYDNIPVFGWIALGGRCRDCGVRISVRYPLVEGLTAGMFLLLGAVELLSGGANLPVRPVPVVDGVILLPWTTQRLLGILAYHLMLLSTLLAAALIEYDKKTIPWRLAWPALIVGLLAPVVWPFLHPVPAGPASSGWLGGLVDSVAGLSAGLVLGLAVERIAAKQVRGLAIGAACVGLFLGWQAVAVIGVVATAADILACGLGKVVPGFGRLPFHGWLAAVSLSWLLLWQPLTERLPQLWS